MIKTLSLLKAHLQTPHFFPARLRRPFAPPAAALVRAYSQKQQISWVEQGSKKNGGANAELGFTLRFAAPQAARTKRSSGIPSFGRDSAPMVG
jgi:hypothetical protein